MLVLDPNAGSGGGVEPPRLSEDIDSSCSTPFVSAPSSPGRSGYFFSAPASPMHFLLINHHTTSTSTSTPRKTSSSSVDDYEPIFLSSDYGSFEFEFSSRFSPHSSAGGILSMPSADELFFNGQIRPMMSSHLHGDDTVRHSTEEDVSSSDVMRGGRDSVVRGKNKYYWHRKARSMSPLRFLKHHEWHTRLKPNEEDTTNNNNNESSETTTPSCSASSSRSSSSSGRNSKKWIFLKELLHRSKSDGGRTSSTTGTPHDNDKAASSYSSSPVLSPSSSRDDKKKGKAETAKKKERRNNSGSAGNGIWRRRSAHELHYAANRAQAEEMKKRTFLPYRQGLLGCLSFSSKSYGAFTGFTKNLNPISSKVK